MNTFYRILLFMIFFNVAAIMIAATSFFGPNCLYGDISYAKENNQIRSPEDAFNHLIAGSNLTIDLKIVEYTIDINWGWLLGGLLFFTILIAWKIGDITPVGIGLLITMFIMMFNNSKNLFDSILTHLDSTAGYVGLMIGLGVMFAIVITIMDIITKQKNV